MLSACFVVLHFLTVGYAILRSYGSFAAAQVLDGFSDCRRVDRFAANLVGLLLVVLDRIANAQHPSVVFREPARSMIVNEVACCRFAYLTNHSREERDLWGLAAFCDQFQSIA